MNDIISIHEYDVIEALERLTIDYDELRQLVIYTYYDKNELPLYVGVSKDFYMEHSFNSKNLRCFKDIKYVGFVFLKDKTDINELKKYYIRARQPQYNQRKYEEILYSMEFDVNSDDFVVSEKEMVKKWKEWIATETDLINPKFDDGLRKVI